jgi:hypothetical protein
METVEIMHKINRLPIGQQMFIAERIIHSIREIDRNNSMKKAVDRLYDDYRTDKNLTEFSQLDFENFYEAE